MKVRKFVAANMQEALKRIREELGADAVILSNDKTDEGVEIVAALDYDEQSASEEISVEGQPSPSRIAKLHAQRHVRLQEEMGRAKEHITKARIEQERAVKRQSSPARVNQARSAMNHAQDDEMIQVTERSGYDELSKVREEIESLKGLISQSILAQQGVNSDTVSALSTQQNAKPAYKNESKPEPKKELKQEFKQEPKPRKDARSLMSVTKQQVQKRLESLCLSPSIQESLLANLRPNQSFDDAWPQVQDQIEKSIAVEYGEIIDQGGVIALVGPTGSGKTTSIGKLAARYVMKFGPESVALVTTDRYRVAAYEQLRVFGRILNVPVHSVSEQHGLDSILDKLSDKRLVLVDTAGLMPGDPCWAQQLQELKMSAHRVQPYLVMPAVGQYQVMCANYHHYKMANLAGAIVTKVDEAVSLGEVMSFLIDSRLHVAYFTDGQRMPEDIHRLDARVLLDKAEALLNSSERWVTIHSRDSEGAKEPAPYQSAQHA